MRTASNGAALAVALVLLTGLSALALAAAAVAVTALALAGHQQGAAIAIEAAEAGIAYALQAASEQPGAAIAGPLPHSVGGITQGRFESRTTRQEGSGALPPGFTIGSNSMAIQTQHYFIVSDGQATRDVRVRLEQGFYVLVSLS